MFRKVGEDMEVQNIPIPAPAAIKVTKEGKQGVFETKIIQTTDNKYIYCLPVRRNNKVVNFSGTGLTKEIKVYIKPGEVYVWRNISIARFVGWQKLSENQNQNTGNAVYVLAGSCKRRGRTEKGRIGLIHEKSNYDSNHSGCLAWFLQSTASAEIAGAD